MNQINILAAGTGTAPTLRDYAADLAFFLQEKTGSIYGQWQGQMKKAEQIELMGRFLGKGTIVIDGAREVVFNRVKVSFGRESEIRNETTFGALALPEQEPESVRHASALPALAHIHAMTLGIEYSARSGRRLIIAGALQ